MVQQLFLFFSITLIFIDLRLYHRFQRYYNQHFQCTFHNYYKFFVGQDHIHRIQNNYDKPYLPPKRITCSSIKTPLKKSFLLNPIITSKSKSARLTFSKRFCICQKSTMGNILGKKLYNIIINATMKPKLAFMAP